MKCLTKKQPVAFTVLSLLLVLSILFFIPIGNTNEVYAEPLGNQTESNEQFDYSLPPDNPSEESTENNTIGSEPIQNAAVSPNIEGVEGDENTDSPQRGPVLEGWVQMSGNWYYYEDGVRIVNAWRRDSVDWCYLGSNGIALTNSWAYLRDSDQNYYWFYFQGNCRVLRNHWQTDSTGWCYVDSNGRALYSTPVAWRLGPNGVYANIYFYNYLAYYHSSETLILGNI